MKKIIFSFLITFISLGIFANGEIKEFKKMNFDLEITKVVFKNISLNEVNKKTIIEQLEMNNAFKTKNITSFTPVFFWMLVSNECWQLMVWYQDENGQNVISTCNPPPGGGYVGTTSVCLGDNLNPGSPYNSFNTYC